ncbi:MAG: DNA polymerase/3'-5' exonuclease PolX [Phycisphaerae bacterium]
MSNRELADIFDEIAELMELFGENRYRINSYQNAARAIRDLSEDVAEIARRGELEDIPSVGKSTAEKIRQYVETGKVQRYEELRSQAPAGLPDLMKVPGLGPKTVSKLWKEADIKSLDDLRSVLRDNPEKIAQIEGLGEKKVRQMADSLEFASTAAERITLDRADELAGELVETVRKTDGVKRADFAGSLRRGKETIGDIDLLCEASQDQGEAIIAAFAEAPNVRRVLAKGKTKGSVVLEGEVQADLRVVPSKSYGAALAYFTGSKEHNVALRELAIKHDWKLNEYGLFQGDRQLAGKNEKDIYEKLELQFVPPELREDRGEIDAAARGKLPELVSLDDIRGDLHVHTTATDGINTIEQMAEAARERGYAYLAICDHSKSQIQAGGLSAEELTEHAKAIREVSARYDDIEVLAGVEVDIFKDGRLDFDEDVLSELDFVTASPHSALSLAGKEATRRLIKAIENPCVNCIGHPSGRLLGRRRGMEIDIEEIAAAAAENDTALEINAHPMRLDLRDVHVRAAIEAGAKIIINTDSHSTGELDLMKYGVATARRGWAEKKHILNTRTAKQLKKWLGK